MKRRKPQTITIEVAGFNLNGHAIIMDLEDYLVVRKFKLCAIFSVEANAHYVHITNHKSLGISTSSLHRYVLMLNGHDLTKLKVDFVNYNTLDLRKSNLKIVTNSQIRAYSRNRINKKSNPRSTSQFTGVTKDRRPISTGKVWVAKISCNLFGKRKTIGLGSYLTEIEAAYAFNLAAQKVHGVHANLNPVTEQMVIDAKNAYNSSKEA